MGVIILENADQWEKLPTLRMQNVWNEIIFLKTWQTKKKKPLLEN